MNFLPKLWNSIKKISLALAFITLIIGGGWAANHYDKSKKPPVADKQLIVEGDNALNNGYYSDAKRIFADELHAHPKNKEAAWGLQVSQLRETFMQVGFKEALDSAYQQHPDDPHINLFLGEFYAASNDVDQALKYYTRAIAQSPKLAEAHYDMARLYDQQGNAEEAIVEALKAIDIAPIPKYRNNLGAIYFKQQHYEQAIKEFGRNKEYPLSALESAKIYWRLEYLSQAVSYQKQAIEWLEDKRIMAKLENQELWYFETSKSSGVVLPLLGDKKSYAYYSLSVSLFLQGDYEGAAEAQQKLAEFKVSKPIDIRTLMVAELDALVAANASFAEPVAAYKKLYL